jgi:hypothetical protein
MPNPPSMFDAPHPAVEVASLANYIQPELNHGLRIWWAFYWPTVLVQMLLTIGVNKVIGRYLEDPRLSAGTARALVFIARFDVFIFYYLVAFLVIGSLLRRNFRNFRIGLLPRSAGEAAPELSPTIRRVARVWWTFSWRSVVYRLIAAFVISFPLGWIMGFLQALAPGPGTAALVALSVQVLIDAVVGMYVIYSSILDEDISDFRVALLPRATSSSAAPATEVPNSVSSV